MINVAKPQPKISVIIVSWNVSKLIDKCISTLISSLSDVSHEIFVVDNASIDSTCDLIKAKYPQVTLIANDSNLGFPKANNQAFKICRGEFVFFLNPDTEVQNHAVQHLVDKLTAEPTIGLVGPLLVSVDGRPQSVCARPEPTPLRYLVSTLYLNKILPNSLQLPSLSYSGLNFHEDQVVDALNGAAMLCRRSLCEQINGMDETLFMYLEDIDFCRRIRDLGLKVVMCAGARVMHHEGQSSKQVPIKTRLLMLEALLIFMTRYQAFISPFMFRLAIVFGFLIRMPVALIFTITRKIPYLAPTVKFKLAPSLEVATLFWALSLKKSNNV